MFGLVKTAAPTSNEIASRIGGARESIARAEREIPSLRAESKALEEQVAALLGKAIAEATDAYGPRVAELRQRRAAIADEVDALAAAASVAQQGIVAAERERVRAQIREKREAGNAVRRRLAPLLRRGADLLDELWALDFEVAKAAQEERDLYRAEVSLSGTGPHIATPPSGFERTGVIWPLLEAFSASDSGAGRVQRFDASVESIRTAAARAEAVSEDQLA